MSSESQFEPYEPPVPLRRSYETKDSGERRQFASGMQRDTTTGKARPDLVRSGPMFQRWVQLLTRGAAKYDANNWMKAAGQEEYDRFLESAARHFEVWFHWRRYGVNIENPDNPTTDPPAEDHGAAVFFNVNGVEYVAEKTQPLEPHEVWGSDEHTFPCGDLTCHGCYDQRDYGNSPDDRYMD